MAKLSPQMWLSIEQDYMGGISKAALSTKYGIARQSIQDHFRSRPYLKPGHIFIPHPCNRSPITSVSPVIISAGHSVIPAAAAPPISHYPTVPPYIPPNTPIEVSTKKSVIIIP